MKNGDISQIIGKLSRVTGIEPKLFESAMEKEKIAEEPSTLSFGEALYKYNEASNEEEEQALWGLIAAASTIVEVRAAFLSTQEGSDAQTAALQKMVKIASTSN